MASAIYGYTTGPLRVTSEKPEVNGWGIVCCGYCSGQMAARLVRPELQTQMEAATLSAHRSRALRGRPHNNGANVTEVRDGTYNAMGVRLVAATMAQVLVALKAGKAACYQHEYGLVPSYLRHQSGTFGHSACLCYYRRTSGVDYVGWFDPLAAQGSKGLWAKWSDLQRAAWGGSQQTITTRGAPAPPAPNPEPPKPPVVEPPSPKPPGPSVPPWEPPTDPIPPVVVPEPGWRPPARVWPSYADRWGAVSWPAPPPPPPAPWPDYPDSSWWDLTRWEGPYAPWSSSDWGAGAWSSGRW